MDFKIDDNIDNKNGNNVPDLKIRIIIIAIISIVIGLTVFFVINHFLAPKKPVEQPQEVEVSLNDENVQILYKYISYGTKGIRNDKFVKEKTTNLGSFSNEEKYYYALQFAEAEDFEFTGEYNDKKKKIYAFPINRLKEYMERYFGPEVSFSTDDKITHPFGFTINEQNLGTLTYSVDNDEFNVTFDGFQDLEKKENEIDPFYTKLVSATKLKDNTLVLKEKVIYIKTEEKDGAYTMYITKDYEHNNVIETRPNMDKETLDSTSIDINNYLEKASTITYTFKVNNNVYYFSNSEITE